MDRHPHTFGNLALRKNVALLTLVSLALFLADMVFGFLGPVGGAMLALVSMTCCLVLAGYLLSSRKPADQSWVRFSVQGVVGFLKMFVVLPLALIFVVVALIEFRGLFPG
ncbi:hypothetical protein [Maricaulis sp.]|uniref:hypothetical protein n=1 Tax=Maricaulis sp. TaxID=1486257 RepID=UPI003A91376B